MKKGLMIAGKIGFSLLVFLCLLEMVLRVVPAAIPTKALFCFEPGLRGRIAKGHFSTSADTVIVPRDDGGPKLHIWKPYYRKPYRTKDAGAVAIVPTDEMGFCNPPGTYTNRERFDVMAIGDSFTWGHAVNPKDTWAFRLGQLTGLSVYNLGKGGTGLYEYVQILKRFGLPKRPRVVIMNVYEGNDIRDALEYHRYTRGFAGNGEDAQDRKWKHTAIGRHSYTFNLLMGSIASTALWSETERGESTVNFRFIVGGGSNSIAFNEYNACRDEVIYPLKIQSGEIGFDLFDKAMESFARLAEEHQFTAVVSYTPSAYVTYAPVKFEDPVLATVLPAFSDAQRAYFARKTKELGMTFVDMTPALKAAAFPVTSENLLYFPDSIHYTARGHATVAGVLVAEFGRLGLLAPKVSVAGNSNPEH